MARTLRARPGRLLSTALAAAAFALSLTAATTAFAVTGIDDKTTSIEIGGQVFAEKCSPCHGNIADTKNYASSIIFKHGYHQLVACGSCHSRFPHQQSGTETPKMKACFNCHGVRHGSMGLLAKDDCSACHVTPKWRLRPSFHTADWAQKPHVDPANREFNTKCAMCHKPADCTGCHEQKGIHWGPEKGWAYDPGEATTGSGCLACHGSATLMKNADGAPKSFQVTGVEDSAHRGVTCQQCHTDYRYDDKPQATKLWTVNAGIACSTCHQDAEKEKDRVPVADYEKSVHAQKIRDEDYSSATCASCHGGHFIYRLDTQEARDRMHASAYRVCARCHQEQYDSYNDYYHGKAYKAGSKDAPTCWDCHKAHDILPSSDKASAVSKENVGKTCGREGCHKGSSEQFGTEAESLIHRKVEAQHQNPIVRWWNRLWHKG